MTFDSHVHSYPEAKVLMTKTGELMIGLPIYANHAGSFFTGEETEKIVGVKLSIGMYEPIGYIAYNPTVGEMILPRDIEKLEVEDLGLLGEQCPKA